MLHEIYCEQFHQKRIVFNPGLSVVLGTNTGDNSIGKSTFLLIVDYVFGGSTYAGTTDIIENVGSHDIYFSFIFGEETFKFCRNSINAHTVWKCNDSYEKVEEIGLSDLLSLTKLPILVHDSVVLKQISDDAIEKIIELYSSCGKQVIIALDKQDSYSEKTSRLLGESAVLRLSSNGQELFGRSWG